MLTGLSVQIKIAGRIVLGQAVVNIANLFKPHVLLDLAKKLSLKPDKFRTTGQSAQVRAIRRAYSPIEGHIGNAAITLASRCYVLDNLSHPMNLGQDSIRKNNTNLRFHEKHVIMNLRQDTIKLYAGCKMINSFGIDQRVKHVLDLWELRGENPFSSNVLCLLRQQGNLSTVEMKPLDKRDISLELLRAKNAQNKLFTQLHERIELNSFRLMIVHSTVMGIFTDALLGRSNAVIMDESETTNIHYVVDGSEPRMKGNDSIALQVKLDANEILNNNNLSGKESSPLNIKVSSNEAYGSCAFFTWNVRETCGQAQLNLIYNDILLSLFQLICTLRVLTTAGQIYARMMRHAINSSHNQVRVHSMLYLSDIVSHSENYEKHTTQREQRLSVYSKHGLILNVSKCQSFMARIRHSGQNVSRIAISILNSQVKRISIWPQPDIERLRSLLACADCRNELFSSTLQNGNWEQSKKVFVKSPSPARDLNYSKGGKPFLLDTDLSALCVRVVQGQTQNESEIFRACASSDNPSIRIIKDLERVHNNQDIFKRRLYPVEFDFDMSYRSGESHVNADVWCQCKDITSLAHEGCFSRCEPFHVMTLWLREMHISTAHSPTMNSQTGQTRSCLPNELETYGNSENNRGAVCYFYNLRGLNTNRLMSEIMRIFQIKRK